MSFYNPYSKYPDIGQGMQDIGQQLMMMRLMQQLMGRGNRPQQMPQAQGQGGMGAGAQAPPQQMGQPPQGAGSPFGSPMPQMDPQMLMMVIQAIMNRGG